MAKDSSLKEKNIVVSVVIAAKDAEEYLQETLDSLKSQTYKDFEVIFVDDASTDKTLDILNKAQIDNLTIIRNKESFGPFVSANIGLQAAVGKYVARLDADDVCNPERLELQVEYLDSNPEIDAVGSHAEIIDFRSNKISYWRYPITPVENAIAIMFRSNLVHSAVMMRKEAVDALKGYSTSERKAQDYDLWVRMLLTGRKMANIDSALISYRVHESNISHVHGSDQENIATKLAVKVMKEYLAVEVSLDEMTLLRNLSLHRKHRSTIFSHLRSLRLMKKVKSAALRKFGNESEEMHALNNELKNMCEFARIPKLFMAVILN